MQHRAAAVLALGLLVQCAQAATCVLVNLHPGSAGAYLTATGPDTLAAQSAVATYGQASYFSCAEGASDVQVYDTGHAQLVPEQAVELSCQATNLFALAPAAAGSDLYTLQWLGNGSAIASNKQRFILENLRWDGPVTAAFRPASAATWTEVAEITGYGQYAVLDSPLPASDISGQFAALEPVESRLIATTGLIGFSPETNSEVGQLVVLLGSGNGQLGYFRGCDVAGSTCNTCGSGVSAELRPYEVVFIAIFAGLVLLCLLYVSITPAEVVAGLDVQDGVRKTVLVQAAQGHTDRICLPAAAAECSVRLLTRLVCAAGLAFMWANLNHGGIYTYFLRRQLIEYWWGRFAHCHSITGFQGSVHAEHLRAHDIMGTSTEHGYKYPLIMHVLESFAFGFADAVLVAPLCSGPSYQQTLLYAILYGALMQTYKHLLPWYGTAYARAFFDAHLRNTHYSMGNCMPFYDYVFGTHPHENVHLSLPLPLIDFAIEYFVAWHRGVETTMVLYEGALKEHICTADCRRRRNRSEMSLELHMLQWVAMGCAKLTLVFCAASALSLVYVRASRINDVFI